MIEHALPGTDNVTRYRVTYAIHKLNKTSTADQAQTETAKAIADSEIIGMMSLKSEETVPLQEQFTIKTGLDIGVLKAEIGYLFLPSAWGAGYATEAAKAVLEAVKKGKDYFAPYKKVYIEAITAEANPASQRVLIKAGLKLIGLNHIIGGEPIFLAGAWREPQVLVFGAWVIDE